MKLLFFHRLDLVHLYAPVSMELSKKHQIIHVVYSEKEEQILKNEYQIQGDFYNITELRNLFYNSLKVNEENIKELDEFIINNSQGRFCLNSSIYLDRTYKNLSYQDSILMSWVYYKIWKHIFSKTKPDLYFHEPPALMMTHLAVMFCRHFNAHYLTQIQVSGMDKFQWIFLEGDDAQFIEFELNHSSKNSQESFELAEKFIQDSNANLEILFNDVAGAKVKQNKFKFFLLLKGVLSAFIRAIRYKKSKINPVNHIDQFLQNNKKSFFEEIENLFGRLYESYYSKPDKADKYYFYPLHLEPEAVVLYYADGWYEGQIKLIQNIAAQLPPNTYLYIKDHPHGGNYRNVRDYKKLLEIRNLKIIEPGVSGKALIRDSIGVFTINGTAGFEALLMNKKVFCFGKAFYNNFKGVVYVEHIKNLKEEIYKSESNNIELDAGDIQMFLESSHKGFVNYFANRQNKVGISLKENAILIAKGIEKFIFKLNVQNTTL